MQDQATLDETNTNELVSEIRQLLRENRYDAAFIERMLDKIEAITSLRDTPCDS